LPAGLYKYLIALTGEKLGHGIVEHRGGWNIASGLAAGHLKSDIPLGSLQGGSRKLDQPALRPLVIFLFWGVEETTA
jgi:hypothetical protein